MAMNWRTPPDRRADARAFGHGRHFRQVDGRERREFRRRHPVRRKVGHKQRQVALHALGVHGARPLRADRAMPKKFHEDSLFRFVRRP
jgi:hypothetical protein